MLHTRSSHGRIGVGRASPAVRHSTSPCVGRTHIPKDVPALSAIVRDEPAAAIAQVTQLDGSGDLYLDGIARQLEQDGLPVTAHTMSGHAESVIPAIARQQDADLIVMATHGRSGLARLAMGSVATDILKATRRPVL